MSHNNRPRSPALRREPLEAREVPALITVTSTSGALFAAPTTLRQAIALAETLPGPDVIQFGAGAFNANGDCVIELTAALPKITQPLQIVGFLADMNRPVIKLAPGALLFRIFDIDIPQAQKGAAVFLGSLEIVGGQTPNAIDGNGGGIKSINADLTVNKCFVHSNHAFGDGGGIWATGDQCMVWVQGATASVSGNFADGYGGGIAVRNIYTLINDGAQVNDY